MSAIAPGGRRKWGSRLPCRRVLTTSRGCTASVDMTPAVKPAIVSMSDGGSALLVLMDRTIRTLGFWRSLGRVLTGDGSNCYEEICRCASATSTLPDFTPRKASEYRIRFRSVLQMCHAPS